MNICKICGPTGERLYGLVCRICRNKKRREKYQTDEEHRAKRIAQGNNRTPEERNAYYVANKEHIQSRVTPAQMLYRYGITVDDYDRMLVAQNGVCKTCGSTNANGKALTVDHCHITGKVRGLLCSKCNTALGMVNDQPGVLRNLATYLES